MMVLETPVLILTMMELLMEMITVHYLLIQINLIQMVIILVTPVMQQHYLIPLKHQYILETKLVF